MSCHHSCASPRSLRFRLGQRRPPHGTMGSATSMLTDVEQQSILMMLFLALSVVEHSQCSAALVPSLWWRQCHCVCILPSPPASDISVGQSHYFTVGFTETCVLAASSLMRGCSASLPLLTSMQSVYLYISHTLRARNLELSKNVVDACQCCVGCADSVH